MSKQTIFKVLPVIILSSLLTVAIIYAWREPTQAPPGGNVPAPINVGWTNQHKSGALGIGGVFQAHGVTANPVLTLTIVDGNVGIGTTNPSALLEVSGRIKITGGSPGANKVLTSDASGLASWQIKGEVIPSGVITMYSGEWNFDITGLGTGILSGWALCNGNNGTPNLSNRFVMGTTTPPTPGATGGDHFFSLSINQLPSHKHTIPEQIHNHTHQIEVGRYEPHYISSWGTYAFQPACGDQESFTYLPYVESHALLSETTTPTGGGALIDNRPAYIQLAYIMKL